VTLEWVVAGRGRRQHRRNCKRWDGVSAAPSPAVVVSAETV